MENIWQAVHLTERLGYGMQTAESALEFRLHIRIPWFLFAGVLTENIWQAVQWTKPLRYGTQTSESAFEPCKDILEVLIL